MGKFTSSWPARAISVVLSVVLGFGSVGSGVSPVFASGDTVASDVAAFKASEQPTVVEELVALREEDASTYRLSDGTTRTVVWSGPIRFRDETGAWSPLDPKVVPGKRGLVGRGVPYSVEFSTEPTTQALMLADDGWRVSVSLLGGSPSGAYSLGGTVVYPEVARDTDLVYELGGSSVKETAVLRSAASPERFTFRLDTDGLKVVSDERGVTLVDPVEGAVALSLGALEVFDEAGVACADATTSVSVRGASVYVTYRVPRAWLDDPARVFPVRVDPTLSAVCDTYVSRGSSTPRGSATTLKAGKYEPESQAYFKFDLSSIPATVAVLSAAFRSDATTTGAIGSYLMVRRCTQSWNNNTVWSNRPAQAASTALYTSQFWGTNEPMRAMVAGWVSGSYTNYGLALAYDNSNNSQSIISSSESNAPVKPSLVVDWESPSDLVPLKPAYVADDADSVTITLTVDPAASEAHASVVGSSAAGPVEKFKVAWFATAPSPSSWDASAATGGGYFGIPHNSAYAVTFRPAQSYTSVPGVRRCVVTFTLRPGYGDVQSNRVDSGQRIGTGSVVWTTGTASFGVLPAPVTSPSVTARGLGWGRGTDYDGDGVVSLPSDSGAARRVAMRLAWQNPGAPGFNPTALGTKVHMFDGRDWKLVASVPNTATTGGWDTEGQGVFPASSRLGSAEASSSRLLGVALSPCTSTVEAAAVVSTATTSVASFATDGKYFYLRPSGTSRFRRIGTGSQGTTEGADYGLIGPAVDWAGAFVADGYLCGSSYQSGYMERIPLVETTSSAQHWFQDGGEGGGGVYAGYGGRVFAVSPGYGFTITERDTRQFYEYYGPYYPSVPASTHVIPGSFAVRCAVADRTSLLIFEYTTAASMRVVRVDTTTWKETGRWSVSNTPVLNMAAYDETADVIWLSRGTSGRSDRYLTASGVDFADDARHLYRAANPSQTPTATAYYFKVVPYNSAGAVDLSLVPTLSVTPPNRTLNAADDPRHAVHSMDAVAGAGADIMLDAGAARFTATDIEVPWDGPEAAVRRTYRSDLTTETKTGAGWRFNFDARVDSDATGATYTDSEGEPHRFSKAADGTYHAPNGMTAWLTRSGPTGPFTLTTKDRSVLTFDTSGRLASVADRCGRTVTYTWTSSRLTIRAVAPLTVWPYGNALPDIQVYVSDGKVSAANAVRRCADYSSTSTSMSVTVHSFANTAHGGEDPSDGVTETVRFNYGYTSGRITSARVLDYPQAGQTATWDLAYDGSNRLSRLDQPGSDEDPYTRLDVAYGTREATVTAYGLHEGDPHTPIRAAYAWNPNGTMSRQVESRYDDEPQRATSFTYGPTNDVVVTTRADGLTETREIDGNGNVTSSTDASGAVTTMAYDGFDRVWLIRGPGGGETRYAHDEEGNTTYEERALEASGTRSQVVRYFDDNGRPTRVDEEIEPSTSQPLGVCRQTTYTYDAAGRMLTSNVPVSLNTTGVTGVYTEQRTYDATGNLTQRSEGNFISMKCAVYSGARRLESSQDASNGAFTYLTYDSLGNELSTITWSDDRRSEDATQYANHVERTYDAAGRVVCETRYVGAYPGTVAGRVTHTYDTAGREIRTVDSVEGTTTTEFNGGGDPVAEWSPGSDTGDPMASMRTEYDSLGREVVVREPGAGASAATTTTYDACGREMHSSAPGGSVTSSEYDAAGNQVRSVAAGVSSASSFDLAGRAVTTCESGVATVTHTYDLMGRELTTRADGTTPTVRTYNEQGWVLSETDPQGVITKHGYDLTGRPIYRIVYHPRIESWIDDDGHIQTQVYPDLDPVVTTFTYDDENRERIEVSLDGDIIEYYYDVFGRLILIRETADDGSTETSDTFDELDNELAEDYDAPGEEDDYSEEWDYADEDAPFTVSNTTYGNGTTEISTISPTGLEISATRTRSEGGVASGQSQARGLAMRAMASEGSLPAHSHTRSVTARDAAQRATAVSVSTYADSLSWSQSYDGAGRMTSRSGTGFTEPLTLSYSATSGKLTSRSLRVAGDTQTESTDMSYTSGGRLASVLRDSVTTSHTYDDAGDITTRGSQTLAYADGGKLSTSTIGTSTTAFGFDGAGRRTVSLSPDEARVYTYDNSGHVTGVQIDIGADATTDTAMSLVFDANGCPASRSLTTSGATTMTTYEYDGLSPVRVSEGSATGTDTVTIGYGEDGVAWIVSYSAPEATETVDVFPLSNERGDILALADEDGEVIARYRYSEWGEVEGVTTSASALVSTETAARIAHLQPLRYAGYVYEEATALYLTGARAYDPRTAQFLSKDPARADGEESAYQYCAGDPVGMVDPSGEWGADVHYSRTWEWVNAIMPLWATPIALADKRADSKPYKDGNINGSLHGYESASVAKRYLFDQAVDYWNSGDTPNAIKYFGLALHTLQDIYAHRRKLTKPTKYVADYANEVATIKYFGHNNKRKRKKDPKYQDDWEHTRESVRSRTASASTKLIARFSKLKKFGQ